MDIFCDSHEITARFEQYVVDLRRLFVFHSIPCGSAEGFAALGIKLEESKAFRLDLSALVRTIHELVGEQAGERMTAEEMLTMLALASGGADLVDGRAETVGLMRTVTLLRVLVAGAGAWSESADEGRGVRAEGELAGMALAGMALSRAALEMSLEQLRRQVSEMERRVHRLEPEAAAATEDEVAAEVAVAEPVRAVRRVREVEPGYAEAFQSGAVAESVTGREMAVRARAIDSRWMVGGVAAAVLVLLGLGVMRLVASMHAGKSVAPVERAARVADAPALAEPAGRTDHTDAAPGAAEVVPAAKAPVVAAAVKTPAPVKAPVVAAEARPAVKAPMVAVATKPPVPVAVVAAPVREPVAAVVPAAVVKAPVEAVAGIVPVGPAVMERNLVTSRKPVFPAAALAKGMEGTVVLNTFIAKDGSVSRMDVLSGAPPFIDSAMAAVSWRRYRPYLVGGRPVAVVTPVTVTYRTP